MVKIVGQLNGETRPEKVQETLGKVTRPGVDFKVKGGRKSKNLDESPVKLAWDLNDCGPKGRRRKQNTSSLALENQGG